MKILVTGAAGLVGSHAAEYYAECGHEVIAFDNLMRSRLFGIKDKSVEYNWDYLDAFKNIKKVIGDVRNGDDLNAVLPGADFVIHAAGQPGVPNALKIPREDFSINAYGTFNILECLRDKSPKAAVIYCSTNQIYGQNIDKFPLVESSVRYNFKDIEGINENLSIDRAAHTPYGASKYAGDLYSQEYFYSYGIRTGVFRMGCIYGPRQFGFEEQGWIAHFAAAALFKRALTIFGNGKQVRDLLYVDDLIAAFEAFRQSDKKHSVINIGGGAENSLSLLECLALLENETGHKPKVEFRDERPLDHKIYITDNSKVKDMLGWKPNTDCVTGIKRVIDWIKQNESLFSFAKASEE